MKKVLLLALVAVVITTTPSFAEDQDIVALQAAPAAPAAPRPAAAQPAPRPPAAPAPVAVPPAPAPAEPPQPPNVQQLARMMANIRFDVTITDTGAPKPVTKTVSLTVSPGSNASIRSSSKASDAASAGTQPTLSWLNVDVRNVNPIDTNSLRAAISVEYQASFADAKVQPGTIIASSTSTFTDGRRTQILVTSDPASDRRTTVDVTATILK